MTRDEILEAAAVVFREKGFHAASMRDIANAVELRKASLYHHISSKQEILLALLDRAMDILIVRIGEIAAQPTTPTDKLSQSIRCYLKTLTEHRDLAAVLLLEYRSLEPKLKSQHIPRRDQFEALWREMIQEGVEGNIFSTPDVSVATKTLLGGMNWVITWYQPSGPLTGSGIAQHITDLFLEGLLLRTET